MRYVIAYDVDNDDARARLARRIARHGVRIQYSVFDCEVDDRDNLDELIDDMAEIVDEADASVGVFPQCATCLNRRYWLGPPPEVMDAIVYIV